jgi:hypothetical protein
MEQAKQTIEPAGTAPKITPEHIASQVVGVAYHRFPGTTVTVCCITLRNGYNTIGHSACVSPENFDAAIGEQIAYKNALNEIWQLEGYLLAEWLWLARSNPLGVMPEETNGSWEQPATPEPLREPVGYAPDVNPVDAGSNGISENDFSAPGSVDSSLSSSGSDYSI